MATGDQADNLGRIQSLLPPWFGDDHPTLSAVLNGIAGAKAFAYGLIQFAKLQTRIRTATGGWLDLVATDFFGSAGRQSGQSDTSFRNEIIVNLFRERATRSGLNQLLLDLTGRKPFIFEPGRLQDTGAYAAPNMGYSAAGAYGSLALPFQAFVTAYRPEGTGIPNVAGYAVSAGGYGQSSQAEYASLSMVLDAITDGDIYTAIDGVKPVGTIVWVRVGNSYSAAGSTPNFSLVLGNGSAVAFPAGNHIRLLGINLSTGTSHPNFSLVLGDGSAVVLSDGGHIRLPGINT